MYIIRLDDASDYMNIENWNRMEKILNKYGVKPIVGIIPDNKDTSLLKYKKDENFWKKAKKWENNGWIIAMHGHKHVYITSEKGLNPIHKRSEFAGLPLRIQKEKIKAGYKILLSKGLNPKIFFSPSHTFDLNTLKALKEETPIRIVSDTIANDIYYNDDIFFIPQQSGRVRKLPLKTVTFCYHPNTMSDNEFVELEKFLKENRAKFNNIDIDLLKKRKKNIIDILLIKIYFFRRKL